MNRIFTLSLTALLALSLLAGCTTQNTTTTPDVDVPEVTQPDLPQVDTDTDVQEELPQVDTPDGEDTQEEVPTGDIALSNTDFTLFAAGESYQLTISNLLDSDIVTFSSSDSSVATVGEDGTVTALAPGSATITADVVLDGITSIQLTSIVRCTFQVEGQEESDTPAVTLDFAAFYEELTTSQLILASLIQCEGDYLTMPYPTISDYDFPQVAVYMPMMSAVGYELALIEVADAADLDSAKAVLQARIDAQINGGAWYPAEIETWTNSAHIITNGNYVMMVAAENAQDIIDAFNAKF